MVMTDILYNVAELSWMLFCMIVFFKSEVENFIWLTQLIISALIPPYAIILALEVCHFTLLVKSQPYLDVSA